jgi:hypothetical protein
MSEESEKKLSEMMKVLDGEVRHLRRLVHFQQAEIQSLRIYAVAKIAGLLKKDVKADTKAEWATVEKITREIYDEQISKLEAKFPAIASDIDIRASMTPQEQDQWYLIEKYFGKKDPPQSD